jgi:hypothetical protein
MRALKLLALAAACTQIGLAPAAGLERPDPLRSTRLDGDRPPAIAHAVATQPECPLETDRPPATSSRGRDIPGVEPGGVPGIPGAEPRGTPGTHGVEAGDKGRGLLAQPGWGRRCYTPYGWCWLPGPGPLGYPCSCCCPLVYGFIDF